MKFPVILFFVLSVPATVFAQAKYTHSHNDYNQNTPFYKAYNTGFNSIEADIFLINGKLLVSHDRKAIRPERTLKEMYLDPIIYAFRQDTTRRLCLLIDVKDNYKKSLPRLVKELKPLRQYLMTPTHPDRLKILVSGNRPVPRDYKHYPNILYFDDDLIYPHTRAEWDRVGQVSLNFARYSKWRGVGALPDADKQRITHTIDSVHTHTAKLVRFWGAPDSPDSWATQIDLGADIIGTDSIDQLEGFLMKRSLCEPTTAIIPAVIKNNQ